VIAVITLSPLPLPVSLKFLPQERLKKLLHLPICCGHDKGRQLPKARDNDDANVPVCQRKQVFNNKLIN
jgi:hypothetical protein